MCAVDTTKEYTCKELLCCYILSYNVTLTTFTDCRFYRIYNVNVGRT